MSRRPSVAHALAERAARAAAGLDEDPTVEIAPEPAKPPAAPTPQVASAALEPTKGRGRPPGKRSDPEFKPTTLFLRMRTKRAAIRLLEDRSDGRDLSELVEALLDKWNTGNLTV